jgi:Flp pilus assembly protein TadG
MPYVKRGCCFMKSKKGQAVVETALVLPLLIIFLCMIIDTGRILYAESNLNLICQESVRIAGLGEGDTQVQDYALSKLDSNLDSTLQVTISPAESVRKSGDYVTVNLSVDLNYITPFASSILPSPFIAKAQSPIRVEEEWLIWKRNLNCIRKSME